MRSSFIFYGVILIMLFSFGGSIGIFPYGREMNYAFLSMQDAKLSNSCIP